MKLLDKPLSRDDIQVLLQAEIIRHRGQERLASKIGVSVATVNKTLNNKGEPSRKVLEFLGVKRAVQVVYYPKD
jgi:DNA-binding phage protein